MTLTVVLGVVTSAEASSWSVPINPTNTAVAASQGTPISPTATASCVALVNNQIKVTWTANPLVSSYTILVSTTGPGTGYTTEVAGLTSTAWTSPALVTLATYWFEVKTYVGAAWVSSPSSPTVGTTIALAACTQL
jgi:hypothetical protein